MNDEKEPEKPVMQLHHWINHKAEIIKDMPPEQYLQQFLQHLYQWFNLNYENKQ